MLSRSTGLAKDGGPLNINYFLDKDLVTTNISILQLRLKSNIYILDGENETKKTPSYAQKSIGYSMGNEYRIHKNCVRITTLLHAKEIHY